MMNGINCTSCGKPLTRPFRCLVCKDDGTEEEFHSVIPAHAKDGHGCVMIFKHKNCSRQGFKEARAIRMSKRHERSVAEYSKQKANRLHLAIRASVNEERRIGTASYSMLKSRGKVLLFLPFRQEVKKL